VGGGKARGREGDGAELLARIVVMRGVLSEAKGRERECEQGKNSRAIFHDGSR
jgi:hypothetical protein